MKKSIFFTCSIFVFSFISGLYAQELALKAVVESVYDGDSVRVIVEGDIKSKPVRMLGIDAPEIEFHGVSQGEVAVASRDFLRELLPAGLEVELRVSPRDFSHGRLIGRIFKNGEDINLMMIEQGMAVTFLVAPLEDSSVVATYVEALTRAYEEKRGHFSLKTQENTDEMSLLEPYVFRMQIQNKAPSYFVGNFFTKELVRPRNTERVPFYARVFFRNTTDAYNLGYTF